MLSDAVLDRILSRLPNVRIGVLGDLFLDRYLDIDATLTEPSLETGLDAYQVVRVRSYPGAAGTVINNLAALGVGRIVPIALIGDDGEGHELRQELQKLKSVDAAHIMSWPGRRTPTYAKPMLQRPGEAARELNRLDIKNRAPTPADGENAVIRALDSAWRMADAWIVLDQVSETDCGVVTARVRDRVAELGAADPGRFVLADSRERIDQFRNVSLKPNEREGRDLFELQQRCGRAIFWTRGERGIWVFRPGEMQPTPVPGYPVTGPIDPVGAGDSVSAGIASAVAAGATLEEAAAFGNLVASITIQQIGVTGTASPDQVRDRWRDVRDLPIPSAYA
jgi:bifunctional ADP-heptose synthase (sugar kinase/adenylyltransferase)